MRIKRLSQIGVVGICGMAWLCGAAACLLPGASQALSASDMSLTFGAAQCVDRIPQTNCTAEFSGCIESAGAAACAVLGCTKCTLDTAYSDCTSTAGKNYQTCTVTTEAGGCGTIRTAPCTIQDSKCKCGTYVGTTNGCAKKLVTATTPCPE